VMARAAGFFLFATGTWALLPLVARDSGGGAGAYGLLLAGIGTGAVTAAIVMPRLRRRFARDVLVRGATVLYATATLGVAVADTLTVLLVAMLAGGAAWLAVLSTLHVSAQTAVPQWVRARALSFYLMVYAAGMTGGALLWGAAAARWGVPLALALSAAGGLLAMIATWRLTLGGEDGLSRNESAMLLQPHPHSHTDIAPERGPVQVHVEYQILPEDAVAFVAAIQGLQRIRRRDGALSWGLFEDAAVPGRYVEAFVVESWAEHLRQHHRATAEDSEIITRIRAFHRGDSPPPVVHWIAVNVVDHAAGDVL